MLLIDLYGEGLVSYKKLVPNLNCVDKGNNKITELRTILQRKSQNS